MENKIYTAVMSNEVIYGKHDAAMRAKGMQELMQERGWGNGYVLVPPSHPYHGKSYTELYDIPVHGGLTFSDVPTHEHVTKMQWEFLDGKPDNIEDYWAFGFDTNHGGDNPREHTLLYVVKEANLLKAELEILSIIV